MQSRRNSLLSRSLAGIEGTAGAVEADDQPGVIGAQRFPFRASRSDLLLLEEIVQGATRVVRTP